MSCNHVENLQNYMLTCKNISKFTRYINDIKPIPKTKEYKNDKISKSVFIPYQDDKLFWIYYYIRFGYIEYNMIGSKSYTTEMECKMQLISELKKAKPIFKENKIKKIDESVSNLLSQPEIDFKIFEMLCILYKFNFILIKDNMYHKMINDDNEDVYIIHYINSMYGCEKINICDTENYEKNRYYIQYFDKPISSIGFYKLEDLSEIANTLDISLTDDNNKKLKKGELYNCIASKVNSFFDK